MPEMPRSLQPGETLDRHWKSSRITMIVCWVVAVAVMVAVFTHKLA